MMLMLFFYSGVSFSFVSKASVGHLGLSVERIGEAILVSSARGLGLF